MIIEMLIGLGLTMGLVEVAQKKMNVYIIDKTTIGWWLVARAQEPHGLKARANGRCFASSCDFELSRA